MVAPRTTAAPWLRWWRNGAAHACHDRYCFRCDLLHLMDVAAAQMRLAPTEREAAGVDPRPV